MKYNPLLISVIVHYRSCDECIQLVKDMQLLNWKNHKIVIVDNHSGQKYLDDLNELVDYENVVLLKNTVNNGYGGGINYAVKFVQNLNPDFYHVINADTRIVNFNYLIGIIDKLSHDTECGMIGPKIEDTFGNVQNTIMPFITLCNVVKFKNNYTDIHLNLGSDSLKRVEVINGVCFVIKAKLFHRLGGFDEDFFMYGEEHDLCFRMSKLGYYTGYLPIRSIAHSNRDEVIKEFTWRDSLVRSNQVLFMLKHRSLISSFILSVAFTFSILIKRIRGVNFVDDHFLTIVLGFFKPVYFNKLRSLANN